MSYERDGSNYGLPDPDTTNLHIETLYPDHEDENHQKMYRWFWDSEQNPTQAYCGQWRTSREQAHNEGVQWLRAGRL